jgi:hypothetical protein
MSLAHEGTHYGYLDDKMGPLDQAFIAARCFVSIETLQLALAELIAAERLHQSGNSLFIKRMVEDEDLRAKRAEGGKLSIGHPHTHPPRVPLMGTVDLQKTIARADSGSVVSSCGVLTQENVNTPRVSDTGPDIPQSMVFSEYPKTQAAICGKFPTSNAVFAMRVAQAGVTGYLEADNPKIPPPDDSVFAAAVELAWGATKNQTSPGLFLKTVPDVIKNWAKYGRNGKGVPYVPPPDFMKAFVAERDERRRKLGHAD